MQKKILIVEGASNSGKTTLCKELQEIYGFYVIKEGVRYLEEMLKRNREEILSVPMDIRTERANQTLLMRAERKRLHDAFMASDRGEKVVLDKSALSILSTAYAFQITGKGVGDLPYAIGNLLSLINDIDFSFMEYDIRLALIKTDAKTRKERNQKRSPMLNPIWVDEEIVYHTETFLTSLATNTLMKGRVFDGLSKTLTEEVLIFFESK